MALNPSEPPGSSGLLNVEYGRQFYPSGEGAELSETTRYVSFQFPGVSGEWAPAWAFEHQSFDLTGASNDGRLGWSGQASSFGLGFSAPGGDRFLVGPDRYEWRTALHRGWRGTLGWERVGSREHIELSDGSEHWEGRFHQNSAEAYLSVETTERSLLLRYGDENNARFHYRGPVWTFLAQQDRQGWPVLTDDWEGETASVRSFVWDYQAVSAAYRTTHPWFSSVGGAARRWQAETQVILPYSGTPGVVEADGKIEAQDFWVDVTRSGWQGRILLRRAEPSGTGAHYSLYFPGLGERWPESDIDEAWLLGGRLQKEWMPDSHTKFNFWVQQWWPLAVNYKRAIDNINEDDDEETPPRFDPTNRNSAGADTNDTQGNLFRGMQVGLTVSFF